jgi:soluble lytic murein transglycosylase
VSREHPLALHRVVPVVVVVVLAAVAYFAVRGPAWYQRLYHPLSYQSDIAENARTQRLDPYLVAALVNAESGFDAGAVSDAGAIGLMQLLPATAAEVARDTKLRDRIEPATLAQPGTNLRVGTRHLRALLDRYGRTDVALAAYNAGPVAVDKWIVEARRAKVDFRDVVDFPATRHYIDEVLMQQKVYAELYPGAFEGAK